MYDMLTSPFNNHQPYGQYGFLDNTDPSRSPWPSHLPAVGDVDGCTDMNMLIQSEKPTKSTASVQSHIKERKKLDHNAKEKMRRMKLNDSYSTMQSLLPDSHKSKKNWSAPLVVARVLEYIPELQKEVEKLTQKRDKMLWTIEKKHIGTKNPPWDVHAPTVSMTEVNKREVIAQICGCRDQQADVLSTLLAKLGGEGISIDGISTLLLNNDRVCFHLHLRMKKTIEKAFYIEVLRDKIVSWFCEKPSNFLISTDTQASEII